MENEDNVKEIISFKFLKSIFLKSIVSVKIPSKNRLYHPKTFHFGTPLS
jgi:hypothetical protein